MQILTSLLAIYYCSRCSSTDVVCVWTEVRILCLIYLLAGLDTVSCLLRCGVLGNCSANWRGSATSRFDKICGRFIGHLKKKLIDGSSVPRPVGDYPPRTLESSASPLWLPRLSFLILFNDDGRIWKTIVFSLNGFGFEQSWSLHVMSCYVIHYKGKGIPLQARCGSEGG